MIKKLYIIFVFILGELMASSLPKYYTQTLENGLEVVAIPLNNKSSVVTTDIFYKVGSRDEIMGKSGIAHMLEHLNFKSTDNMKAGEFDEIVKSFGGLNNASTGFDYTHYYIKSSSPNMDKSLSLFADMMQNLKLLDEEFQPERDVVAEERRWRTDNNPIGYLYFRLFNNAYLYHSYHWTPIGFTKDIENWSIDDIKDFHSTYYQPKNAIVVVAGDIDKDDVFASAKKHFGSIKNTKELPKKYIVEPKQDGAKRVEIEKPSEVEMVAIAYHVPNFQNKDQVALSAIAEILSSGKSSWLQKELIDNKRLVNTIYGYNLELIDPGLFLFMAICNNGVDAEGVEKEILAIIEKIKTTEVSQEELNKIKINTKADFIFSLESSSSVANLYGSYLARGDMKPLFEYEENIEKLTTKEIKEVANKYFDRSNSTTVILRK
jgi:predicted Zn-dependent peptidase